MSPPATTLRQAVDGGGFTWLAGIEDTFITAPNPRTGRTLDEYELTGHYERWWSDLALLRELGVQAVRYGLPWHRLNPEKSRYSFGWAERAIERLLELGIEPVLDLVHYGVPAWLEGAFAHPDYPAYVEEYAARVAERFRDRIHAFTPLNEPRITAWYAGRLGWWPPHRRDFRGFVEVLLAVCRGIARTTAALRSACPDALIVHVDACDLYEAEEPALEQEAEFRQQLGFLALDLVSGRVGDAHPLRPWLLARGATVKELEERQEHPVALDVIGLNLYPMFSLKRVQRRRNRLRIRASYANGELVERLGALYHRRYARPLLISETASEGSVARRMAWLDASVAAVSNARARGIPIAGYTWWPLFALVAWAYREGTRPVSHYLKQMGLWDLRPDALGALERVPTKLVERYRALIAEGAAGVGSVAISRDP
jgi:beta-glucosidase/6-phospho-beta-glucosidase/beta-galactosidase